MLKGNKLLLIALMVIVIVASISAYIGAKKERELYAKAPFPINSCFIVSFETESQRPIYVETTDGKYNYAFVVMLDSEDLTLTKCKD